MSLNRETRESTHLSPSLCGGKQNANTLCTIMFYVFVKHNIIHIFERLREYKMKVNSVTGAPTSCLLVGGGFVKIHGSQESTFYYIKYNRIA